MIIAAYAGTGKTTLAKMHPDNCVEVASMPFARILPYKEEDLTAEFEREKAAEYHINNPLFPFNMIREILEKEKEYKYVIIPSAKTVIEILQNYYHRNIILCYPEDGLEEEYKNRYLGRGNTEIFCHIFVDEMKFFLLDLKANKRAHHIVLKSGEYLSDKFFEIEKLQQGMTINIPEEDWLNDLKQKIEKQKENVWLKIEYYEESVLYKVANIDDEEERLFLYHFSKRLYKNLKGFARISSYCLAAGDVEIIQKHIRVVDKKELATIL